MNPYLTALALAIETDFGATLGSIALLAGVLALAYLTTRFVASKTNGLSHGAHMRVKERIMLARDKSVVLLETDGTYYLLGVTAQNLQLIASVKKDELPELPVEEVSAKGGTAMGLFRKKERKSSGPFNFGFGTRKNISDVGGNIDELIAAAQKRREARYPAGSMNTVKPEFQEILSESMQQDEKEKGE